MRSFLIMMIAICALVFASTAEAGPFGRRGGCNTGGCSTGGGCGTSQGCGVSSGCQVSSGCNISQSVNRASAADLLQQPAAPVKAIDPAAEQEARARAKAQALAAVERRKHTLPFAAAWSNPVNPLVDGQMSKQLYAVK